MKRTPSGRSWRRGLARPLGATVALLLLAIVPYLPALGGRPLWDDRELVFDNPLIKAADGLYRIWFTTEPADYYPVLYSSWWIQWRLWGENPVGYHVVNVLLHAVNAVLLWRVLARLQIPGAWWAALLFATHPVNVPSVAWIAELKNTLSFFFGALSVAAFLRYDRDQEKQWYGLALALFSLSLLSKPAGIMLPVVLLGYLWYRHGRLRRSHLLRTIPFGLVALAGGLTTIWFQYHRVLGGEAVRDVGFFSRLAAAGSAVWFYLGKLLLPAQLNLIYPFGETTPDQLTSWLPSIALLATAAILWRGRRGWGRIPGLGFGYFVVMLLPVLGFVDQGFYAYSLVADHWQYLPMIGILAALAALGKRTFASAWSIVAVPAVGLLAVLTWQRAGMFRGPELLWRDTLTRNPQAWVAHNNLGTALAAEGQTEAAIGHYTDALRLKPDYAAAHSNLGAVLAARGRLAEAIGHYTEALRLNPDDASAHSNLGSALVRQGRPAEAIVHCTEALRLRPDLAEAHSNLGLALAAQGKVAEAIGPYTEALRRKPDLAETHHNLGLALAAQGQVTEAISHYTEALRLNPQFAQAHNNLAVLLAKQGEREDAIGHYREALRLQPDFAEAHNNLGLALVSRGRSAEAVEHFTEALRQRPDYANAHYHLGLTLADQGRVAEAIDHYMAALRLGPDDPAVHYSLGCGLALQGDHDQALVQYREALRLRPDYPAALNNLAWILATHPAAEFRDGTAAVRLAERACELNRRKDPGYLDTLAAAYAEAGRFQEAVVTAQEALQVASTDGQTAVAAQIQEHLMLYQAGRPYRDSVKDRDP